MSTDWGVIVAHAVTEATVDDATTAIELIQTVDGCIASVTADAAYDEPSTMLRGRPSSHATSSIR